MPPETWAFYVQFLSIIETKHNQVNLMGVEYHFPNHRVAGDHEPNYMGWTIVSSKEVNLYYFWLILIRRFNFIYWFFLLPLCWAGAICIKFLLHHNYLLLCVYLTFHYYLAKKKKKIHHLLIVHYPYLPTQWFIQAGALFSFSTTASIGRCSYFPPDFYDYFSVFKGIVH